MRRVPTNPSPSGSQDDANARRQQSRRQGLAYQGAAEAVAAIFITSGAGYWLDSRFDKSPLFLFLGTAIGFAAFVLRLVRLGRQLQALDARETGSEGSDPNPR
jgi:F0F1-type ATP synthase assembly protein I